MRFVDDREIKVSIGMGRRADGRKELRISVRGTQRAEEGESVRGGGENASVSGGNRVGSDGVGSDETTAVATSESRSSERLTREEKGKEKEKEGNEGRNAA